MRYPPQLKWLLAQALNDTERFWGKVAEELHWFKHWDRVFEWNYPFFKWFSGGITNLSYNCVDYHVFNRGEGNRAAIIWESAETGETRVLTYSQLHHEVLRFANALKSLGVSKGDRVSIYMPMIPEAAIAMLATTRIGAVHSVIFGGFGTTALADRLINAGSKILLTADVGYRRGKTVQLMDVANEALKGVKNIDKVIILKRSDKDISTLKGRDIFWEDALEKGKGTTTEVAPMRSDDLAFILHTSGTMAKPKGTVQTHGGYQVHIYAMGKWVYSINENDIWWCLSDIGWIVGHSYVVYAPLLFGCSTIMYEGVPDYPVPDIWWQLVEKNRVTKLWFSPTGVRALMKYGEEWPKKHDLSTVKAVFCAGEVLNPAAWEWLQLKVFDDRIPVIDHMWQTETSGPIIGNPYGIVTLPIKPGSATIPLPGIDADVVDNDGHTLPAGVQGNFVCKRPFPGLTPTLWRDKERYVEQYWNKISRCYYTGDAAVKDDDGYFWFVGRSDEVIKIAAHRIGTIEIENILITHAFVAEAAVVGKPHPLKGEVATAFIVLKPNRQPSEELKQTLRELVKKSLGAIVVLEEVNFINILPKTRSGKIMRRLIKAVINGQDLGDCTTIEDEASIDEIKKAAEQLIKSIRT